MLIVGRLPQGRDADSESLKRLCRDGVEAFDRIDQAVQNPPSSYADSSEPLAFADNPQSTGDFAVACASSLDARWS